MNTALIVMDLQNGILDPLADDPEFLPRVDAVKHAARASGIPVIHVAVRFREGHPEVSADNKMFSRLAAAGALTEQSSGGAFASGASPLDDEIVVVKRRVSAFTGSDLAVILQARDIRHLVLAGVATSGVVLSTVRQAADLDFKLTVLEDCCRDHDPEVHRVLTEKVFRAQATVTTGAAWIAGLGGPSSADQGAA